MRWRTWIAWLCLSATASAQAPAEDEGADALGAPAEAAAAEAEPANEAEPAPRHACAAVLEVEGRSYQACGNYVVVLEDAQVVRIFDLDVSPTDLFERNGGVWFELEGRAHALDAYEVREPEPPAPPPPPAALPPSRPPPAIVSEPAPPPFDGPAELDPNGRYRDRVAPERVSGVQLGLSLTPVLGGGLAIMGDAFVAYRARRAFSARLVIDRLGYTLTTDDGGRFGVVDGTLLLGYDHRYFEMSFGVGTTRARIDDFDRRLDGMAPTLAMGMRFGALDGLHLSASTSLIVADGETSLARIAIRMQFPLNAGRWLVFRGSGSGPSGYGWGEVGLRILTRGQRGSGSLFITPAIGGGGLFDDTRARGASGFAMTLGLEYRP